MPVLGATYEPQAVLEFVRSSLAMSFPAAANISDDEDLFSFGFDSLNIAELVAMLKAGIEGYAVVRPLLDHCGCNISPSYNPAVNNRP